MTDHVARAVEKELMPYLPADEVYTLKAKIAVMLQDARDKAAKVKAARLDADPYTTTDYLELSKKAAKLLPPPRRFQLGR